VKPRHGLIERNEDLALRDGSIGRNGRRLDGFASFEDGKRPMRNGASEGVVVTSA
jgi:hypothetical protein